MTVTVIACLAALGIGTGFLAGLLGIGGGMILTPMLTLILSVTDVPAAYTVHIAIATSMATILFTSLSSVRAHHKRGAVLWKVVLWLAPGIVIGAMCGSRVVSFLPSRIVSLVFVVFVFLSAIKMILNTKPAPSRELPGRIGLVVVGLGIGFLSAIVGAGGGFIAVPFMIWCNVKMHNAVGTSAALGFPIAVAGTIGYVLNGLQVPELTGLPYMLGFIHLPSLVACAAASVLMAPVGARLAHSMDTKPLKRAFAGMLFILAGYMAWHALAV